MKILGALIISLCLPGMAFAQHAATSFGSGGSNSTMTAGGGAGGGGATSGEVIASMTHAAVTHYHYPAAHNDGGYVPSGFVPFAQAVSNAKPAPAVGTFLPFDAAVQAGREANEPMPSLGDFARQERARHEQKTASN